MGTGFVKDDAGITSTIEFMLSFIIAAAIFSYFVMNLNFLFVGMPEDTVRNNQFIDVGNDISTKLIDTYLVAPDNGDLSMTFDMPGEIVGDSYTVSVEPDDFDKEVRVSSNDRSTSVFMVLNGASSTIPINGTTNSTDQLHIIKYHYKGGH